jgi:hypothetical protein
LLLELSSRIPYRRRATGVRGGRHGTKARLEGALISVAEPRGVVRSFTSKPRYCIPHHDIDSQQMQPAFIIFLATYSVLEILTPIDLDRAPPCRSLQMHAQQERQPAPGPTSQIIRVSFESKERDGRMFACVDGGSPAMRCSTSSRTLYSTALSFC